MTRTVCMWIFPNFVYIISLQACYNKTSFPLIHVLFHIKCAKLFSTDATFSHFHRVIHMFLRFPHVFIHNAHVYIILSTVSFFLYIILYPICKQTVKMSENADLSRFSRIFAKDVHLRAIVKHDIIYLESIAKKAYYIKGFDKYEKTT